MTHPIIHRDTQLAEVFTEEDHVTCTLLVGQWVYKGVKIVDGRPMAKVIPMYGRPFATAKVPFDSLTLKRRVL